MAFERFTKLIVFGLSDFSARAMCCQMMGFIKNHQVPSRCIKEPLDTRRALQCVDAGNQPIMLCERVGLSVGNIALGAEHLEIKIENIIQFFMPIIHQPCRNNY